MSVQLRQHCESVPSTSGATILWNVSVRGQISLEGDHMASLMAHIHSQLVGGNGTYHGVEFTDVVISKSLLSNM